MHKLVFDIGATAIKYAIMDNQANILEKGQKATFQDSFSSFKSQLETIYLEYKDQVDGIALSLPGTIDSKKGQIYAPGGLLYNANINLIDEMRSFTSLPISMENDGKSAALAEVWKGNLQDINDGVVLVLGTGIGGGIIKDRKLWKGSHLFAGEFSFIATSGQVSMDSVFAMKGSTTSLIRGVAARKGVDASTLDGHKIFKMIETNDQDAKDSLDDMCSALATQIYNIQCILDPEKVLIGGGISQQSIVLETINKHLDDLFNSIPFDIPRAKIDTCKFYNDSNLIGALYHHLVTFGEI